MTEAGAQGAVRPVRDGHATDVDVSPRGVRPRVQMEQCQVEHRHPAAPAEQQDGQNHGLYAGAPSLVHGRNIAGRRERGGRGLSSQIGPTPAYPGKVIIARRLSL